MPEIKTAPARRLLLYESDRQESDRMASFMKSWGYESKTLPLSAGVTDFHDFNPDVVLINLKLDGQSGLTILKNLREDPDYLDYAEIPVIMLSADTSEEIQIVCMSNGSNDFVPLPAQIVELAMKIQMVLELAENRKKLKELNLKLARDKQILSKYFSSDFVDKILNEEIPSSLGGEILTATILFFDVRGSTTIAETIGPEPYAKMISDLMATLMELVLQCGGSINDLLGDGLLATFGCPRPSARAAEEALSACDSIIKYMDEYNMNLPEVLKEPLGFGVGVATGKVFAGNIGSPARMKYVVMGDPVNLAARLQSLTKKLKKNALIDGETALQSPPDIHLERVGRSQVRGKMQLVELFAPGA